jgi:hypothetical protein
MLTLVLALAGSPLPCPQLPLRAGTSWTYRAQVSWTPAGAAASRDTTITWTTLVLSVRSRDSVRVAVVQDWPTALAWWEPGHPPDTSLVACFANHVYHVSRSGGTLSGLADSLLASLGQLSPDDLFLELPLRTGDLYGRDPGDRPDTFYAWYVESSAPVNSLLTGLGAPAGDSLYTLIYRTMPDHQILDFVPGVGVARYVYSHHGTVAAASAVLVTTRRPAP